MLQLSDLFFNFLACLKQQGFNFIELNSIALAKVFHEKLKIEKEKNNFIFFINPRYGNSLMLDNEIIKAIRYDWLHIYTQPLFNIRVETSRIDISEEILIPLVKECQKLRLVC